LDEPYEAASLSFTQETEMVQCITYSLEPDIGWVALYFDAAFIDWLFNIEILTPVEPF